MLPHLFDIGSFHLQTYGWLVAVAAIGGVILSARLAQTQGLDCSLLSYGWLRDNESKTIWRVLHKNWRIRSMTIQPLFHRIRALQVIKRTLRHECSLSSMNLLDKSE